MLDVFGALQKFGTTLESTTGEFEQLLQFHHFQMLLGKFEAAQQQEALPIGAICNIINVQLHLEKELKRFRNDPRDKVANALKLLDQAIIMLETVAAFAHIEHGGLPFDKHRRFVELVHEEYSFG